MRRIGFVLLAAACLIAAPTAKTAKKIAVDPSKMTTAEQLTYVDPTTVEVLKLDNAAGAYEVPNFQLKETAHYAETPDDIEPFGGVKPYKRLFLK